MVDGGGVEGGERAEVVEGEEVEDWLTRLMGGEGEWVRLMGAGGVEGVEAGSRGGGGRGLLARWVRCWRGWWGGRRMRMGLHAWSM